MSECPCVCVVRPYLPDRGPAGGCGPDGGLRGWASPPPGPPPHTETTGSQTTPAPGSCSTGHLRTLKRDFELIEGVFFFI